MAIKTVEVLGLKELAKSLEELGKKFERNVPRAAGRAGANVIRDAIKQRAPVDTGELKVSISIAETGRRKAAWRGFKVGPTRGKRARHDAFYARWVELGHRIGHRGRTTRLQRRLADIEFGRQDVAPHPFMRPAFEASKEKALKVFLEVARRKTSEAIQSVARPLKG